MSLGNGDHPPREALTRPSVVERYSEADVPTEYGVLKDVSGLGVERNVFRYVPVPVQIRFRKITSIFQRHNPHRKPTKKFLLR